MTFSKMSAPAYPPRHWALVGYPGAGKSTFAVQMAAPILAIDADHRFSEVIDRAAGDVYDLSDNPADHVDPRRIAELLRRNMAGAGVRTIVIDSLTAIITPLVTEAILSNDAGENKNRIAAFKSKALAIRTLQDAITAYGVATLWVYHFRDTRDARANATTTTTISPVELARLRRSLNMQLSIVDDGGQRGIRVDWARRGRSGLTLFDDTGHWAGMPERIESMVYGGLSGADQDELEQKTPASFSGPDAAIAWGFEQGCFRDAVHAQNAYAKCKTAAAPHFASDMWRAWLADVKRRIAEQNGNRP